VEKSTVGSNPTLSAWNLSVLRPRRCVRGLFIPTGASLLNRFDQCQGDCFIAPHAALLPEKEAIGQDGEHKAGKERVFPVSRRKSKVDDRGEHPDVGG
jgi:hypothetical protein